MKLCEVCGEPARHRLNNFGGVRHYYYCDKHAGSVHVKNAAEEIAGETIRLEGA